MKLNYLKKIIVACSIVIFLDFFLKEVKVYGGDACSRVEYYDGCGQLYWATGSSSCINVIKIYMDFECST